MLGAGSAAAWPVPFLAQKLDSGAMIWGQGEPKERSPVEGSSAPPHFTPVREVSGLMQACACLFPRPCQPNLGSMEWKWPPSPSADPRVQHPQA